MLFDQFQTCYCWKNAANTCQKVLQYDDTFKVLKIKIIGLIENIAKSDL